ncbi:MAG: hypothetical protein AAGE65_07860 [Planctomycetota bacterium]
MTWTPAEFGGARFAPVGFDPLPPQDASRVEVLVRDTPDDPEAVVATLPADATQTVVNGTQGSDRLVYTRRYNACGLADLDDTRTRRRRLAFDGGGELILPAADGATDLQLVAGAGGAVTATWRYRPTRGLPAAASWRAYVAIDPAPMDLNTPAATRGSGAGRLSLDLGTFAHDAVVRVVVVSVTDGGVTCTPSDEASVVADAQAPSAPSVRAVATTAGRYG